MKCGIQMYYELGVVKKFQIPQEVGAGNTQGLPSWMASRLAAWLRSPCVPCAAHGAARGLGSRGLAGRGACVLSPLTQLRAGNPLSKPLVATCGFGAGSWPLLLCTVCYRCGFAIGSIYMGATPCKKLLAFAVSHATHSHSVKAVSRQNIGQCILVCMFRLL